MISTELMLVILVLAWIGGFCFGYTAGKNSK